MGKKNTGLAAQPKQVDPTLDALFSASSGPVQAPSKTRYASLLDKKPREAPKERAEEPASGDEEEGDDEELSEASQELEYDDDEDGSEDGDENEDEDEEEEEEEEEGSGSSDASDEEAEPTETQTNGHTDGAKRERKRKRKDEYEDLEDKYLSKLADEDEDEDAEPAEKRQKSKANEEEDDDPIPQHESLAKDGEQSDIEKANRTVYLANVSTTAISSKTAKKELLRHMGSVLDSEASPPEKVESIRFRSVAFSGGSMPKRAAYITGQLMDATTKSANAYVVYSTVDAARRAASKLNGSVVLERHIRVDSVAHPARADHRRCVFVGNLGFVDDESVLNTNEDGQTVKKKRNKTPADIEEGLWRTFSTQGKVESVRVPRDPKSRVGKGIAYVQFYDANDVETALLLDGKKFPPMLPRAIRVTRAKDPRKTANAQERRKEKLAAASHDSKSTKYRKKLTPEEKSMVGRAGRLLGRSAAAGQGRKTKGGSDRRAGWSKDGGALSGLKRPEEFVFEGTRASSKGGRPKDLKLGKKSKSKPGKPTGRGARRAAEWRKTQ